MGVRHISSPVQHRLYYTFTCVSISVIVRLFRILELKGLGVCVRATFGHQSTYLFGRQVIDHLEIATENRRWAIY